jgi:hypothetical protein
MRCARYAPLVMLAMVYAVPAAAQQDVCSPGKDSHEAETFATLSVPLAFTGGRVPMHSHGVHVGIGVEAASIPEVSTTDATPTACRPDKGPENARPISLLVRPRVTLSWRELVFEASWIPPVRVDGVQANLVGLAISHPHPINANWTLGLRVHALLGSIHAPVTCDANALRDPASECFGGTLSDDRWNPNIFGAEATVGPSHGKIRPHLGVGYSFLRPRFEVDFTNAAGSTDHRQVNVNLQRVAVYGGLTYVGGRSSVTAEAYSTPADAVSARVVFRTLLGG